MIPRHASVLLTLTASTAALAQPAPDGFDWVTIGATGNRGWDRGEIIRDSVVGRGSVGYEYRIARTETTTAQWMEFVNTFSARSDAPAWLSTPANWGAIADPNYRGPGVRYELSPFYSNASMHPVGGIGWRDAARFCNWLHNGKSADLSATENGVYDTSTFGYDALGRFTDQPSHHPDARYWIPTWDEWMKAAYYDPQQDRWWEVSNGSDTVPAGGPPGVGDVNSGFFLPGSPELHIPLGSYPQTLSPWGLLDTGGATKEWSETVYDIDDALPRRFRLGLSSYYGGPSGADFGGSFGALEPEQAFNIMGVRIATVVPAPGCAGIASIALVVTASRRRKRAE